MKDLPIEAAPLVLHAGGARSHPELPFFDDGDAELWNNWLRAQRLEVMRVWMEDDARAEENYRRFQAGDIAGAMSAWRPCKPDGDPAWFLLAVFDRLEGPCAYFVRKAAVLCAGADTPVA